MQLMEYGLSVLGELTPSDWHLLWTQNRSVADIAERLGVPEEDVSAALSAAGVDMRGRPPRQGALFELPAPTVTTRTYAIRVEHVEDVGQWEVEAVSVGVARAVARRLARKQGVSPEGLRTRLVGVIGGDREHGA